MVARTDRELPTESVKLFRPQWLVKPDSDILSTEFSLRGNRLRSSIQYRFRLPDHVQWIRWNAVIPLFLGTQISALP